MTNPKHFCVDGFEDQEEPYHYTECGLDNIYLSNGFEREEFEGEETVAIHNVDGLWKAIGLHIVVNQKTIEPKEIKFLRNIMRMTQSDLASKLRVDDQTVARWEKGKHEIPGPADTALRFLFLSSPVAQPDGRDILDEIQVVLEDLIERDEAEDLAVCFEFNENWSEQRLVA